tara:strand:+ start:630 stop:1691 length:1062 start_codon:yes stop_codon:yes gene_type:complete
MNERLVRGFLCVVSSFCCLFGNFFNNSTIYGSASLGTPYINGGLNIEDDYKYTFGIRKIALFPYQVKSNFYKGEEKQLSDNALFGAVQGLEYLFSASSVRNQGHDFTDQEFWLKWSNNNLVTKVKYLDKGSRDLQFASIDGRYKLELGPALISIGGNIMGHPIYGHPAINDYEGYWWDLAYEYGYIDYEIPTFDLNQNGEIDSYYVWIETDEYTEEGYWVYYTEGTNYYWENPNGDAVAYSDAEFYQYHLPHIINEYNRDNKEKDWQAEASIVIGLDFYLGNNNYYSHIWVNAFPSTVGLTEKSYDGDDIQYDIGALVGANLSEHIGVFIEGTKLNYYGREEYNISTGVNWRF